MHHPPLGNNVAGAAHRLDELAVRGFPVFDVVRLGRGRQKTQVARDEHQVIGRCRAVHGALRVGRQVDVVHVQASGKHDAHAGDVIEGEHAACREEV